MSFLGRLFGHRQNGLSDSLELDLKRLTAVAISMGAGKAALGLKKLNRQTSFTASTVTWAIAWAACSALERAVIQEKFTSADRILPAEVRTAKSSSLSPQAQDAIANGCADLGEPMRAEQIEAIHAHLKSKHVLLCHDAHIGSTAVPSLADVPADQNYACYEYLDLWSSPHLLEYATQDGILDLAQAYLGCTPTLYSINAFWSFPNRQPHPYSQLFHRDWEDYRSLVVFTLLTPVESPEEGAHYYVAKSHDVKTFEPLLNAKGVTGADIENLSGRDGKLIAPAAMRLFEHSARRFDGPAGQSFCGDGYGLHRAVVPRSRPRLLLWIRFGNFYNETMYNVPLRGAHHAEAQRALQRIPDTPRHHYVFRYIVNALSAV